MADRREYYKQYKQQNKDKIKQYNAERYELMKVEILTQQRKYREDNTDKIKERRSEKVICDVCGSEVTRHQIARHKRTTKCKAFNACFVNSDDDENTKEVKSKAFMALIGPIEMF